PLKMKYLSVIILIIALSGCGSSRSGGNRIKPDVSIAINISARNNASTGFINTNYFRLQFLQDLQQFQPVNLVLVEPDENPEVVLNMDISNFTLWPRDERMFRRRVNRRVVIGTDASGRPVYQTVT